MCTKGKNLVILAAAGSRKTQHVVDSALAVSKGRVLITTYTNENQRQIVSRIEGAVGSLPPHIEVMGWFSFLIQQCAKPYQRAIVGHPSRISGLNFKGQKTRGTPKTNVRYFLDKNDAMYRDGVSDFVVELNQKTNGAVVARLERVFTHIFIDEVQDLVGYDLNLLDLLMASGINIMMVGDPRQQILETNIGPKNKKYRGVGLWEWFQERSAICMLSPRSCNHRSNQAICDFSDAIFPAFPPTTSMGVPSNDHEGVFQVRASDVPAYIAKHGPVTLLRYNKNTPTLGLQAMNIGIAKGSTFDRVMIFPTQPMLKYLDDGDPTKLKAPEKLYVASTRARFSVAFVVQRPVSTKRLALFSASA